MGIRKVNAKTYKRLNVVTSFMGGLSLVSLFNTGFNIGWVQPFRQIVEQYLVITNNVRYAVEPFIVPAFKALSELFAVNITFGANWPDIFLLMIIYLGSRVKSYISGEKYIRAGVMLMLSVGVCVVSSFFASSVNLNMPIDVFNATAIPLLGFLAYDLVYSTIGASLDRGRATWLREFVRHLTFSVPLLLLSLFLNYLLANILMKTLGASPYQAFVIIFAFNYFVISLYWVLQSLHHAEKRENRLIGESVSERFWRSSATNVALNVGLVLASAISFMLGNAGLQSVGVEASQLLPLAM